MRLLVWRKNERAVDLNTQQIAHRVGVFGAIQAMEVCRPAGIRARRRCAIELGLEPSRDRVVRALSGRRLRGGGIARDRSFRTTFSQVSGDCADALGPGGIDHEAARLQLRVVARNAVGRDDFARGR